MGDWSVPAGNQAGVNLDAAWAVPAGDQVGLNFSTGTIEVTLDGWVSALFGAHLVKRPLDQVAVPPSMTPTLFGQQHVAIPGVHVVTGFNAALFGDASIRNSRNWLTQQSWTALSFGAQMIAFRIRYVGPSTEKPADTHGTGFIGYRVRSLEVGGPYMLFTGLPAVSRFGDLRPLAIGSLRIGEPAIYDPSVRVRPSAGDTAQFGDFGQVQNLIRVVRADSAWPPNGMQPWGEVAATVMLRFVEQAPERVDTLRIGSQKIANRDRSISASAGNTAQANNANSIANTGIPYPQTGFRPGVFGQALIAPSVRTIGATGFVPFRSQDRHHARHLDFQVLADGLSGPAFGNAMVFDPAQTIRVRGWQAFVEVPSPWASHLDRTLGPRDIPSRVKLGVPFIAPAVRYLQPQWVALTAMGITEARKFPPRELKPKGPFPSRFGLAGVANVTPELRPRNTLMTLFGDGSRPYLEFRFVGASGADARLVPPPGVAFLDRTSKVFGALALKVGTTRIRNQIPDPPPNQSVFHNNPQSGLVGNELITAPTVQSNVLWPEGFVAFASGTQADVRFMGAAPAGIPAAVDQVGYPTLNPAQFISAAGDIDSQLHGEGHLWPHYIWAPKGYPHGIDEGHCVDYFTFGLTCDRPGFGQVSIQLGRRTVTTTLPHAGTTGAPQIELRKRFVAATGFRSHRVWFPRLNAEQELEANGLELLQQGLPSVSNGITDPWPMTPEGIASDAISDPGIQLQDREIPAAGAQPLSHGLTWISHELDPFMMTGISGLTIGTAWASHRVRSLPAEGFETQALDWTVGSFVDRMNVEGRAPVRPIGVAAALFGGAWVGNPHRTLHQQPTWLQEMASPTVSAVASIGVGGLDSAIFGDVQDWEPGKIKPQSFDDLIQIGIVKISRNIAVQAVFDTDIPLPDATRQISVGGEYSGTVSVPVLTHGDGSHVCFSDSAGPRGVPVAGFDATQFGAWSVST